MPTVSIPKSQQVRPQIQPSNTVSPYVMARQGQAMQQFGQQVSNLGSTAANMYFKAQAVQEDLEVDRATLAYDKFLDEEYNKLDKDPYYSSHRENFEKAHTRWTRDYLSKVKSERAKQELENYFGRQGLKEARTVQIRAHKMAVAEKVAKRPAVRQLNIKQYLDSMNPEDPEITEGMQLARRQYEQKLSADVANGMLTPEGKEQELRNWVIQLVQTAADGAPEMLLEDLDRRDLTEYISKEDQKRLLPDDWDNLRADTQQEIRFQRHRLDQAQAQGERDWTLELYDMADPKEIEAHKSKIAAIPGLNADDIHKLQGWADSHIDSLIEEDKDYESDQTLLSTLLEEATAVDTTAADYHEFIAKVKDLRLRKDGPGLSGDDVTRILDRARKDFEADQQYAIQRSTSSARDLVERELSPADIVFENPNIKKEELQRLLAESRKMVSMQKQVADVTVQAIDEWFDDAENRKKGSDEIWYETQAIVDRARAVVEQRRLDMLDAYIGRQKSGMSDKQYDRAIKKLKDTGYSDEAAEQYLASEFRRRRSADQILRYLEQPGRSPQEIVELLQGRGKLPTLDDALKYRDQLDDESVRQLRQIFREGDPAKIRTAMDRLKERYGDI